MKKRDEKALYFFTILALVIVALVVLGPKPMEVEFDDEYDEDFIEIDALQNPGEAENLVGQAIKTRKKTTCEDSDGGKNEFEAGVAEGFRWRSGKYVAYEYADMCYTEGRRKGYVKERYCSGNRPARTYIKCDYGCKNVWVEEEQREIGVCNSGPHITCTETDNGNDPYNFGIVSNCVVDGDMEQCAIAPDTCSDDRNLMEYYCDGDMVNGEAYDCRCVEGECVAVIECYTDSDCYRGICDEATNQCIIGQQCAVEGQLLSDVGNQGPQFCCEGLVSVPSYNPDQTGICTMGAESPVCTNCGDGICGRGENICNCRQDCGCTDTDGGNNQWEKGTVTTASGERYTDYCKESTTSTTPVPTATLLNEMYCIGDGYTSAEMWCEHGCVDGACIREGPTCGNGICEEGETYYCPQPQCNDELCEMVLCQAGSCPQDCKCIDTDGGIEPYTYGEIEGPSGSGQMVRGVDKCSLVVSTSQETYVESCSGNYCKLHEKHCYYDPFDGNEFEVVATRDFFCANGCKDGACKTQVQLCTDTDGGKVYEVKGTTTNVRFADRLISWTDICKKDNYGYTTPEIDNILSEGYCQSDGYGAIIDHECPTGCEDGACLPKSPNNYCCPRVTDLDGDGDIDCKDDWLCCCGGQGTYGPPCGQNNFGCYYSCGDCPTPPPLLWCETLGGKMYIASDGTGFIGCDTKILGDFDDAYCIGEYTKQQANLIPDSYGRENQYYATLRNLNPDEVVRVFVRKNGVSTECEPALNMPGCTDTDGGVDIYTYGSTTGYQPKLGMKYTADDMCLNGTGSATSAVQESWCEGNELHTEVMQCSVGCQNGACIKESSCSSSGIFCGGIAGIPCCAGLSCQYEGTYPDAGGICRSESSCSSSGVFCGGIAGIPCCAGLSCQYEGTYPDAGGICRSLTTDCADSDGGLNIYQYGVVKGSGAILYDKCVYISTGIMSTTLNEAYCSIRGPAYQRYECTFGCVDGACL